MRQINIKLYALLIFILFVIFITILYVLSPDEIASLADFVKLAYKTIPLIIMVITIFIGWIWKLPFLHPILVPFPNLNGTWEGNIQSTWRDPETDQVPGPIPVTLTIKQSFTQITCIMRTGEMTSESNVAGFWFGENSHVIQLVYNYHSIPSPLVSHRSQPHEGTIVFEIMGSSINELHGRYWTSRKTTGEITLKFKGRKRITLLPKKFKVHPMAGK